MRTIEEFKQKYPSIHFNEPARERLQECLDFINSDGVCEHEKGQEVVDQFHERMAYLDGYGGTVGEFHGDGREDDRRRFRVSLGRDFAPLSFSVVWEQLDPERGVYEYCFNGGFICHCCGAETFTVSLTPQYWGIHT